MASIASLVFYVSCYAQEDVHPKHHSGVDGLFISPFFEFPGQHINITSNDSNRQNGYAHRYSRNYVTNANTVFGLALTYGDFSVSAKVPGRSWQRDQEKYGTTKGWETRFTYWGNLWVLDLGAHKYKGFYDYQESFSTSDELAELESAEAVKKRPDIFKKSHFANVTILPLNDINYGESVYKVGRRGLNWSPALQASYDHIEIGAEQPLIDDSTDAELRAVRLNTYGLAAGGALKYRGESFLAKGLFLYGKTQQTQDLASHQMARRRHIGASRSSVHVDLSYFFDPWACGMEIGQDFVSAPLDHSKLLSQVRFVRLSVSSLVDLPF